MYTPIWNTVQTYLDVERMQGEIEEFFELSRWSSYDKILELAQRIARKMEAAGLEDVRLITHPADGKTSHGGWKMPLAYDVHAARLTLLTDEADETVLADYHANPTSLILYSLPTPPEGITAELVLADRSADMTPERVAGKLVLTNGIGLDASRTAMRAGALGIVSDCRAANRLFKNGPEVDLTNEWHNYTIPPWNVESKGFGFSISPALGRWLRTLLAKGQTLRCHALVDTRPYEGVLPVVSGRLPGMEPEEIVLTGHYDEFGADDNCSQVAVGLEVCRAILSMQKAGKLPPLKRSIRLLFPMEVRGFNALIQNPEETRHMRAGLNIDTVGTDQSRFTSSCTLTDSFIAHPSYAEEFLAELLSRLAEENPLFRYRRVDADVIDNIFGEPLIGAPTPSLWHYSATHHLATDTPEKISGPMLRNMTRIASTYVAFLANAGHDETEWLAELVADQGVIRMEEVVQRGLRGGTGHTEDALRQLASLHALYSQRLESPATLLHDNHHLPASELVDEWRHLLIGSDALSPKEDFRQYIGTLQSRLKQTYDQARERIGRRERRYFGIGERHEHRFDHVPFSQCVPFKTFRGFFAFEDLSDVEVQYVREVLKIPVGWGAPMWLQNALMLANGRRTAGDIARLLYLHTGKELEIANLEAIFRFLAACGAVRLRPYLTQQDVEIALREGGVGEGDLVQGHFSLGRCGYIEGGADALIDTLLRLLGPEGTLMMPTFTFSWLGRLPYDPEKTPSRVGAVTDRFWRREGVLRSAHPTHSFAAIGPRAAELLDGHDHTRSPLSANSPLSRLAEWNGKILIFSPPRTNTIMHLGDYRAGLPLVDFVCPISQNGERMEVIVPDCPWHGRFDLAYEKLIERDLLKQSTLGERPIYVMLARDAIAAQSEVMHETPEYLISRGCDCIYCQRLKQQITLF